MTAPADSIILSHRLSDCDTRFDCRRVEHDPPRLGARTGCHCRPARSQISRCPVGGTKDAAAESRLMFFVGGKADTLEAARPALTAVSSSITHLGAAGAGATWKLINNWMLAAQVVALARSFAERIGFDLPRVATLILSSSTASPIVKSRLPRILEKRFDSPDFVLSLMHKDTRYALQEASRTGLPLDMLRASEAAYSPAVFKAGFQSAWRL